jgi:hypothetical protein
MSPENRNTRIKLTAIILTFLVSSHSMAYWLGIKHAEEERRRNVRLHMPYQRAVTIYPDTLNTQ